MSAAYSASTNRRVGECTDANGNLDGACGYNAKIYDYDASNRLIRYGTPNTTEPTEYAYSPGFSSENAQRVWKRTQSIHQSDDQQQQWDEELTFYGGNGQKLVSYTIYTDPGNIITAPSLNANNPETYLYFGGKLIKNGSGYVSHQRDPDRLGSVGKFFPYGQESPSATANDTDKFATYYRDDESGLDYANNRYHAPGQGRFNTPDPYGGSTHIENPNSWNRYAYAGADPVNHNDPGGLDFCQFEIFDDGCLNAIATNFSGSGSLMEGAQTAATLCGIAFGFTPDPVCLADFGIVLTFFQGGSEPSQEECQVEVFTQQISFFVNGEPQGIPLAYHTYTQVTYWTPDGNGQIIESTTFYEGVNTPRFDGYPEEACAIPATCTLEGSIGTNGSSKYSFPASSLWLWSRSTETCGLAAGIERAGSSFPSGIPYVAFIPVPPSGGPNSNSYTAGLLSRAGIPYTTVVAIGGKSELSGRPLWGWLFPIIGW